MNKKTEETINTVEVEVVETKWQRFKTKVKEAKVLQKAGLVAGGIVLGILAVSQYNKAKDDDYVLDDEGAENYSGLNEGMNEYDNREIDVYGTDVNSDGTPEE